MYMRKTCILCERFLEIRAAHYMKPLLKLQASLEGEVLLGQIIGCQSWNMCQCFPSFSLPVFFSIASIQCIQPFALQVIVPIILGSSAGADTHVLRPEARGVTTTRSATGTIGALPSFFVLPFCHDFFCSSLLQFACPG